jgi:GntR family transcriptional regulator
VLLVRRTALDASERPIALSEHHYLGHRFQLEVEFRGWPGAEPPGVAPIRSED